MKGLQFPVMAGLVGLLIVVAGMPLIVPPRLAPAGRTRYEYKIEGFKDAELATNLGRLGLEGWDLVFARRALDSGDGVYEAIFKRPLP